MEATAGGRAEYGEPDEDLGEYELDERPPPAPAPAPLITAADAMTLAQARSLSGRRGARLVLTLGEPQTGKTALVASLWQRLLEQDTLDGHRLAGSRTALGLERRAHPLRLAAGRARAGLVPTRSADGGLLHLRILRPDGERVELLIADLAGEQFERVREGRPLLEELPWARRVDRFAVLLDAHLLSRPGEAEIAATRGRRLLLALRAGAIVRESARIAVVVTKADLLSDAGEHALARHEPELLAQAAALDGEATSVRTAVLPHDRSEPRGVGELLSWLCGDDRAPRAPEPAAAGAEPARAIAAFPG
jgi:Double-GTPase 2